MPKLFKTYIEEILAKDDDNDDAYQAYVQAIKEYTKTEVCGKKKKRRYIPVKEDVITEEERKIEELTMPKSMPTLAKKQSSGIWSRFFGGGKAKVDDSLVA